MHSIRCQRRYHEDLTGIFIAVILFLIYGSLYPWVFETRELAQSPLFLLFHSWDNEGLNRRILFDIAVNIAIYIPLGASGYLALRRIRSRAAKLILPVLVGALLSGSIEMIQLFTPQRVCSTVDLITNTLGSILGVLAALLFTRIVDIPVNGRHFLSRDRGAAALLFCWVAFMLFPLFPVLWLGTWRLKLIESVQFHWDPIRAFLKIAEWFAIGRLLSRAGMRAPILALVGMFLLVPIQLGIVTRQPDLSDLTYAFLALVLFSIFGKSARADLIAGGALLIALTFKGLSPFHLQATSQSFSWIPFGGSLATEWQRAIPTLLEKLFDYGASVWLLHQIGLRRATFSVVSVLAAVEILQTHIPGHVPEITDPLIALLLGLGFSVRYFRPRDFTPAAHLAIPPPTGRVA